MRITTASTFRRVLLGLQRNQTASLRAQSQLSSGQRLLRISDDPGDGSQALRLERQLADLGRFKESIAGGKQQLDLAGSALLDSSGLMAEARELMLQAMNGTLSEGDRQSIGVALEGIREQLLERANQRSGDTYLFGGTLNGSEPFEEVTEGGRTRVVYRGNQDEVRVRIGFEVHNEISLPGSDIFGRFEPAGTYFGGLTGASAGTSVDEGSGYAFPEFRHDATDPGTLASVGLALVSGGSQDTILGSNALEIDPGAGTNPLGTGPAVPLPTTPDPDFVVTNELGGELHLDFSAYSGAAYSATVSATGSVSLDGSNFVAMTFSETNLQLVDDATGRVLHVNTTGVKRAGAERVTFGGTTNVFDLMGAIADDLRNPDGLETQAVLDRLGDHLQNFDRHHDDILRGNSVLGARSARMVAAESRVLDLEVQLEGRRGDLVDVDFTEASAQLTQSEYLLQIAQASGARILQSSLLNYLG